MKFSNLLVTTLCAFTLHSVHAKESLSDTIKQQDKALFEAFNQCNPEKWRQYLAPNIEFYQDNDAPTYSRDELEPSFLDRCTAGKQASLIRRFIPEAHEVHPIEGVGAVQFGAHRFLIKEGASFKEVARPRFVHLWEKKDDKWQIIRVISYDH
ncbi:nuclear transport factor 2 family protein [Salinimonas sp. HHU 13199]|uniref:Nuclear transport factor 2 family protein n=1 Tax=Salinimonas profundi TaxID=2729140 RepID=A0ABR8LCY3_9ALTE|nr:nuclear transport factor 2 family protein [Salinimonas profundi]MBD3584178.1 nuclear transport factor 2 family protein [Salinimonas profundi]